jgi:hypothetical protein
LRSDFRRSIGKPRRNKRTPPLSQYARGILNASTELSQGTLDGYLSTLKTHLKPSSIGKMSVGEITAADVRDFWASLEAAKSHGAGGGMRSNAYQPWRGRSIRRYARTSSSAARWRGLASRGPASVGMKRSCR